MGPSRLHPSVHGAGWHRFRVHDWWTGLLARVKRVCTYVRGVFLAPQIRGRITPRALTALESRGWHVHRIGRAAYVHDGLIHLLFGVWARREPAPGWAARLGRVSAGYRRRVDRLEADRRRRFRAVLERMAWWRIPPVRVYRWDPVPLSLVDEEAAIAEARNRAVRIRRGLAWPETELELRYAWGDR